MMNPYLQAELLLIADLEQSEEAAAPVIVAELRAKAERGLAISSIGRDHYMSHGAYVATIELAKRERMYLQADPRAGRDVYDAAVKLMFALKYRQIIDANASRPVPYEE